MTKSLSEGVGATVWPSRLKWIVGYLNGAKEPPSLYNTVLWGTPKWRVRTWVQRVMGYHVAGHNQ
jgi:hypothetical protein